MDNNQDKINNNIRSNKNKEANIIKHDNKIEINYDNLTDKKKMN